MKFEIGDLLYVEWDDTTTQPGWIDKDKLDEDILQNRTQVQTVGFYLGEKEETMSLGQSISTYQYGESITILKCLITHIKRIRL